MYLGRFVYFADMLLYPVVVLTGAIVMLARGGELQRLHWIAAAAAGLVLWTLLEYLTHRFVLHRVAVFARLHDLHHETPVALVGTPLWGTLAIALFAFFLPSTVLLGVFLGSAVTVGLLAGYVWYSVVHHVVHHWRLKRGSIFYRAKLRHVRHHYSHDPGNFGVTTSFWDKFFDVSGQFVASTLPSWIKSFASFSKEALSNLTILF